jgi:hypothetical protein
VEGQPVWTHYDGSDEDPDQTSELFSVEDKSSISTGPGRFMTEGSTWACAGDGRILGGVPLDDEADEGAHELGGESVHEVR